MKKSRSQLLGLKTLGRNPSGRDYIERSKELETKIKSGKLSAALEKRAKSYYWQCLRMARKLHALPPKSFNPNQPMLPGMISQLDFVRIEELIAEKVASSLASEIKVVTTSKKAKVS